MKGNKEFDNIIKQKMEGFVPPVTPSSWASFSEKMDAVDATDLENDTFDAMSRQKLQQYEVGYNAEHWKIMADKLEREFYFVQELLRWKTMEVALMVLLLITLGQFLPEYSQGATYQASSTNLLIVENDKLQIKGGSAKEITAAEVKGIEANANDNQNNNLLVITNTSNQQLKSVNNKPGVTTNEGNNSRIISSSKVIPGLVRKLTLLKTISSKPDLNLKFKSLNALIELLPSVDISPLEYVANLMLGAPKAQQRKMALRIGMFGSSNIDRIVNPVLVIDRKEIPSYARYSLGYSGGVSVDFDRGGRWAYETGMVYTSKQYTPAPVHFQGGNIEAGFSKEVFIFFEINSLSIPLHARYNFFIQDRWRMYAYGGASWQVNIQSYYHLASVDPNNARLAGKALGRNDVLKDIEDELVKGVFDKGALRKNSYLTLDGGIGAERYVRNHWSVFSQVNYMHNFLQYKGGFGPYKDKINTLSVSMGVKMRINR